MSAKCNIKDKIEAYNAGVESFKKALLSGGGKTDKQSVTRALAFALKETQKNNKDFDFEPNSLINPIVSQLKENGILAEDYDFSKSRQKKSLTEAQLAEKEAERQAKEKIKQEEAWKNKIRKITEKANGLDEKQREDYAHKLYAKFVDEGILSHQDTKDVFSKVKGMPHMNAKIDAALTQQAQNAQALDELNRQRDEIIDKINEVAKANKNGKLDDEQDKKYSAELNALKPKLEAAKNEVIKSSLALANEMHAQDFWLWNYNQRMRLNLMSATSLIRNATGAVPDAVVRFLGNSVSSVIGETAMRGINSARGNGMGSTSPILSKTMGAGQSISQALKNLKNQFKYGNTDYNGELTRSNSLNSVRMWKNAMDDKGYKKILGGLSAVINAHPDVIQRTLGATDTFVHTLVLGSELNSIAAAKGLSGAEKTAFMMKPDEKSLEIAMSKADKATYRNAIEIMGYSPDIVGALNFDPRAISKVMIEKGFNPTLSKLTAGVIQSFSILVVPFVKVPINILVRATKYALPEMTLVKGMIDAHQEKDPLFKQRKISETLGDVTIGFFLRNIALNMVAHGMISLGYKDEDEKFQDARENVVGGANQINLDMLIRGLTFQDMTPKKTDTMISLTSVGSLGIIMGGYARAFGKMSRKDREEMTEYSKNTAAAISVPARVLGAELQSMLDNTFLSGTNQLLEALKGDSKSSKGEQFIINSLGTLMMGIVPATHQKLSTPSEPEVKKVFDKDLTFGENLANSLGYKYLFTSSQLKDKYYSLATEDGVTKKRDYVLFDNYMGRVAVSEFGALKSKQGYDPDQPITKLYNAAIDLPQEERGKMFPNGINRKQTIEGIPVTLNDEQWAYLQVQASNYRMLYATPFIMDPKFESATPEQRMDKLKELYKAGLDQAQADLMQKYPDLLTAGIEEKEAKAESEDDLDGQFMENTDIQNQNFNN